MTGFERVGDSVIAELTVSERSILIDLVEQVSALLSQRSPDASSDPLAAQIGIGGSSTAPLDHALARLLPDGYHNDPDAATEYRRLTEASLVDRKIANALIVRESLEHDIVRLSMDVVHSWLRSLTDVRLVVAERIGISGDEDEHGDTDDPLLNIYHWLGYLQSLLLDAIEE